MPSGGSNAIRFQYAVKKHWYGNTYSLPY